MDLRDVLFVLIAAVTILPAFVVAFSRNLVYSAFALLFTLGGMAGLYGFLAADFLAVLQVLVYVGGIMVLILFGVVFTQKIYGAPAATGSRALVAGVAVGLLLFAVLFLVLGAGFAWRTTDGGEVGPTIGILGDLLLSRHLLPFEIASVLLLVVLIGAVTVARKELS